MHFVNIAGPIKILDTFVIQSIVPPHEVQLVNAYNILSSVRGISKFTEANPYQKLVDKVKLLGEVAGGVDFVYDENAPVTIMPTYLIEPEIDGYERQLETIRHISETLKEDLDYKIQIRNQLVHIQNLEIEVDKLFDFDYMKFRFGSMPRDSFDKLFDYIAELEVIVYEVSRDGDNVFFGLLYAKITTREYRQSICFNLFSTYSFIR